LLESGDRLMHSKGFIFKMFCIFVLNK
jgi:hypothetical protein